MFTFEPIGFVRSPFTSTSEIPKGIGARHDVEGVIEVRAELEPGLHDIEGFSHLYDVPADVLRRGWLNDVERRRPGR